ncbi:hypothetical protein [Oligoflexus tunisiensis]|uniref:hypothetical protein n=1 Tax=Oligoflexus tunisiensis TaxID=708132 RepID=UPI00114CB3CC|nr:hypothetical protein [Oligoflexus tunisiensis]
MTLPDRKSVRLQAFLQRLNAKYSLRLHMSILLSLMLVSAFGFNKLLLLLGLNHLVFRYTLVTVLSYLSFFVYLRLWILCLFPSKPSRLEVLPEDILIGDFETLPHGSSLSGQVATEKIKGSGGSFSGGGASASWEGEAVPSVPAKDVLLPDVGLGDESAPVVIPIILIGLAASSVLAMLVVCGTMLVTAPAILGEVALEVVLGIGLARRLNRNFPTFSGDRWFQTALKKTYLFFLLVLISNVALAWVAMHYFPNAQGIVEILRQL